MNFSNFLKERKKNKIVHWWQKKMSGCQYLKKCDACEIVVLGINVPIFIMTAGEAEETICGDCRYSWEGWTDDVGDNGCDGCIVCSRV